MRSTHLDAENRYSVLRQNSITAAKRILSVPAGTDLRLITAAALTQAKQWESDPEREVNWDWFAGYSAFRFRHPKRFELTIWQQERLISISMGRPTYHGSGMRLDFMEATKSDTRVRVLPITLVALATYGRAVGASEIRLVHPINDKVKSYYEAAGLIYVKKGDYLFKRIIGAQL